MNISKIEHNFYSKSVYDHIMLEHRCFDEEVRTRLRADSIIRQFIVLGTKRHLSKLMLTKRLFAACEGSPL